MSLLKYVKFTDVSSAREDFMAMQRLEMLTTAKNAPVL